MSRRVCLCPEEGAGAPPVGCVCRVCLCPEEGAGVPTVECVCRVCLCPEECVRVQKSVYVSRRVCLCPEECVCVQKSVLEHPAAECLCVLFSLHCQREPSSLNCTW